MENEKFDLWCLVELFGHSKIAGKCTEQNIAGSNMLRVDVPETSKSGAFTKYYGAGAIYAINPVTEEVARTFADSLNVAPVNPWDVKKLHDKVLSLGPESQDEDDDFPY
ncbi:hypothetical protein N180_03020 [Pedobacter antarcticus 4BY]|uniref:Uncharacterized protein n=2 Tax=Pedobacter antarcticus TaxID=34086 RepID=A0A081PKL2_9SPHI|nr:hypothetical protein [Pedobacter antarcticus]KEQ31235.1 hypothetical protein N180_03020 [Pedobacter antarcticus 4BY]SFE55853.1 hypothetical protein SAMN03003324_00889 [Pedobacter antarcticus]